MNMKCWHIVGFIFTIIAGTLLHFAYEWSGENFLFALFSPVNESIWEHLKLLFIPMLLFSIIEYYHYGNKLNNFIPANVLSIIIGMVAILVIFYTYTGILSKNYLWADITTFILGVFIAYYTSYQILQSNHLSSLRANQLSLLILFLIIVSFILFTFLPPKLGLFRDPITGTYGLHLFQIIDRY